MRKKITVGFVVQDYNDDGGPCQNQVFIASDDVQWEDEDGNPCDIPDHIYQPYHMAKPE